MNSLVETYKKAVSDLESFVVAIQPIAERFFDFIQTADVDGYLDTCLPGVASTEWLPIKYYSMEILEDAATMAGVYFEADDWNEDGPGGYYFIIPYEYIEDPEAWETAFAKRVVDEKQAAVDAFHKMFPKIEQDSQQSELHIAVRPADIRLSKDYLVYNVSRTANGYYFEYEGFTYNSNDLYYRLSTGEIFLIRDYKDRLKMLEGKSYPPLLKPLTKDQRDAEVEAVEENKRRDKVQLDERTLVNFAERAAKKRRKQLKSI